MPDRRLRPYGLCSVLLCALATTAVLSQPPQSGRPAFRTGIEQIEVSVIARDRDGRFVPDLTIDDFELFEDGKAQSINDVSLIDLPIATAPLSARVLPRDVSTNVQQTEGRIYVLVLDDLQVEADQTFSARRAAREFVERHMAADDIAAIVTTGGFGAASEFTQDRLKLLQIIDSFVGQKDGREPATASNLQGAAPRGGGGGGAVGGAGGRQGMGGMPPGIAGGGGPVGGVDPNKRMKDMRDFFDARRSMDTLRNIAESLGRVDKRKKSVLYFGQGIDYDVFDVMGKDTMYAAEVRAAQSEAIAAATRNNVAFYTIDPRGLPVAGFGAGDADSLRRSLDSQRALGHDTGGLAWINNNDYRAGLARVVEENSRYYVLGYHPKDPKRDGRFHRIDVKVRRPGISIVARPGYTAPDARRERRELEKREKADRGKAPRPPDPIGDQLTDLLGTPLSVKGLDMRLHAAPFKGSRGKASVVVTLQLDGATLPMALDKDGKFLNKIHIALIAVDSRGNVAHSMKAVANLAVPDDQSMRLRAAGLRWLTRFDLVPGRYHLRLAATEAVAQKNGSALCDLEVPDFEDKDRSVSGLLLTSNAADLAFTQGWKEVNTWDQLPAPPTNSRVFVQNDVLFAVVEVYDRRRPPRDQTVVFEIQAADGKVLQQLANTFRAGDFRRDRYVPYLTLPLHVLPPGHYVMRVRPEGSDEQQTRALSFEVLQSAER